MAYLTGIYLRNFQSIAGPVFLQLDKLCLLYGPNSAGKSAILDALDIIKKIVTLCDTSLVGNLLIKNQRVYSDQLKSDMTDSALGIEFILPSKQEMEDSNVNLIGEFKRWSGTNDSRGEWLVYKLFSKLEGKKIQIEFSEHSYNSGGIKVAVDGDPFFELTTDAIFYDQFYKKSKDRLDEPIYGRLIIHKGNKFYSALDECVDSFHPFRRDYKSVKRTGAKLFRKLCIEEDEDLLKIYGIVPNFSDSLGVHTEYVNVVNWNYLLYRFFFPDHKSIISNNNSDDKYKKFMQNEFGDDTKLGRDKAALKRDMLKDLVYLSEIMNQVVTGFFHYINYAITNSHVKGSRQMLDSRDCLSYPNYLGLPFKDRDSNKNNSMIKYSEFLVSGYSSEEHLVMETDFINESLQKYLPSLKNYEIYASFYNLSESSSAAEGHLIYLRIKNKNLKNKDEIPWRPMDHGFEDVGSGISYIFPVLTSLWYSKLSFIEQPELHLHPSAQCELGDVFIAAYHKGSIAIAESHSEHILLRILRRIRETTNGYLLREELKFDADNLRIYYFNPEPEGYTSVKEIRVDKHGEFLNSWPNGFFSERDKELFGGFSPQRDKELFGE